MGTPYPTAVNARRNPGGLALIGPGGAVTHADLEAASLDAARALQAHGVRAGDRVALLPSNSAETAAVIHAVPRLGATLALLHARLAPAEIAEQIARLGARLVVTAADAGPARAFEIPEVSRAGIPEVPCMDVSRLLAQAPAPGTVREPREEIEGDAPHSILFTSGSTGRPKAVVLSFANHAASARAQAASLGVTEADRWLLCLPLSHAGGLAILLRAAVLGFTAVLHPRFDPAATWRALRAERVTILSLVPEMLARTLAEEPHARAPEALRTVLLGGGPAPAGLLREARGRGFGISTTYGLTEAASQVATLPWQAARDDREDCGPPLAGTAVRLRRADGSAASDGEEGEILVRGPTVTQGYLDDPEATRAAFENGWLRTGDIGRWSGNGGLVVLARRDDLFVSGGENVSPAEIEAVLCAHPAVAGAIVCGVADERWGRAPAALVALRSGSACGGADLAEFAAARLARFKVPRRWLFADALPMTGAGKPDRAAAHARLDPESSPPRRERPGSVARQPDGGPGGG